MKHSRLTLSLAFVLGATTTAPAQDAPSYARQVRPFLAKYCLECHNAKTTKAGLNLETHAALMEGSDSGSVVEAGKPDDSRLVLLTEHKDKPVMPPKTAKFQPTKAEVAVLRAWVKAGAKDDSVAVKVAIPDIKPRKSLPAPVTAVVYNLKFVCCADDDPAMKDLYAAREHQILCFERGLSTPARILGEKKLDDAIITALDYSPTDDVLAVAVSRPGAHGRVFTRPSADKLPEAQKPRATHGDAILAVAFHPKGEILATCGYDSLVKLTDLKSGKELHTLKEHSDAVYGVAFSPDGKLLASCSADRAVKVFDVASGKLLYTLGDANDWLYTVAWSPDGKHLAAGGVDKSIRVYAPTAQGAKLTHSVFAHEGPVTKVAFAPDSATLYSVGEDRVVKAWDVEKMVERKVYDRQPEAVLALAVRADGKQLALGRYDGAVVLLDPATGKQQVLTDKKPVVLTPTSFQKPAEKVKLSVKQVVPPAGTRGQAIRVTLHGTGLDDVAEVSTNAAGATVKIADGKTAAVLPLDVQFPATTTAGGYTLTLKAKDGTTVTATFIVDAYPVQAEGEAGGSPATGRKITLPASVAGTLDRAGDVDFYRFEARANQELGVQIVTAAIGSKLEPSLHLLDLSGRLLAEGNDGHLGYRFREAGTYALGVRDRELRGGANMSYRLHLGSIPVVTALFPLGLQRGTEGRVQIDGVFLDQHETVVKAAMDAGVGSSLAVPVTSKLGTPLGRREITVGEFPEVRPELVHRIDPPQTIGTIPVPGTANGALDQPGDRDGWVFQAKKGQRLVIEVQARRLGSPLDSVIEVLDAKGQPVPRAVLRCQAKTYVTFRDHDSVAAGIRIEAWGELRPNDLLYVGSELMKIQALPGHPDSDCTFFNSGGRLGYLDTTPTHHAMNTPMYKVSIHPPGTTFPPNGFPVFTLHYRNDDGGPGYGRDSRLFFDPPADGEYRVRVADARGMGGPGFGYRLTVRPPRPSFNVRFSPTNPSVAPGTATSLAISADRLDGYDGPIQVRFDNVPPGFSVPPTVIEAGTFNTAVTLYAEPGAKEPAKAAPLKLAAEAVIDGQKQVKEMTGQAPKLGDAGDLVTVTEASELTIKPGGQAKIVARIDRRNGFAGRVPLEVRGLPHGVRVIDIGLNGILINESETRRVITIEAEPWVAVGEHPFVVLAKREGKNTEHAAKSVLLRVGR